MSHLQLRDESLWEPLVYEHQQAIFRLAYLLLGDVQEAEDVTQEVFIRAFRAIDRFDPGRPMRPWLLSITTRLAANHRRSLARYLKMIQRFGQTVPQEAPDIGALNQQQRDAQALWHAVRRLSRADQEVIYLRYFLELPEAEMAHTLGIAPGTVKSRLHRALGRLRGVVEQEFPTLRTEDDDEQALS